MKKAINLFVALALGASVPAFVACSPEDKDTPAPSISSDELVKDVAYSVEADKNDPNVIHLKSLVKGATPCWETPQGRSQASEITMTLPFAGEYTVRFGVTTGAGLVWGEPYTFTLETNKFEALSDAIWTDLAGGVDENGVGNPKTWVPMDRAYLPYKGTAVVGYMSPDDVLNDGSNISDITLDNWNFNWDPGFQDWLIPATDPYMDSEMTLSLDAAKGCVAEIKRVDANGVTTVTGGFNLNTADSKRPVISFNDCEMLHAAWGDNVCANYSQDLKILTVNPYVLQIATMRTNDEGPWWIVWNFVAKDVRDGKVEIPAEGPEFVETKPVVEPEYDDLATELFTISGDDASYVATKTTLLLDEETPYDLIWWNGANGEWEWIGGYGSSWAPVYGGAGDFALTLNKSGKAELESAEGGDAAGFTISGNKIIFDKEITLLSTGNVAIKGTEFTVMKCSADDNEVVFGIPVEKDATGAWNKYLCAKMTIKPISGGQSGPLVLAVNNANIPANDLFYVNADKYIRVMLYNPWSGKDDSAFAIDPTKLKLKKGQTIKVRFTISGIEWTSTPKAVLCAQNANAYGWDAAAYAASPFVTDLNTAGETELTFTNETGSTYNFYGNDAIEISIDLDGTATSNDISGASVNITSVTIE